MPCKKERETPDMTVVAGKFKPMRNKRREHLTKDGASVAQDENGRKSLPTGLCPWTQRSLTRLHQRKNSFKEVLEIRSCELGYLLGDPSPPKPKKERLSIIKRFVMRRHSEKGSAMFQF
jgi:hypothetical protein